MGCGLQSKALFLPQGEKIVSLVIDQKLLIDGEPGESKVGHDVVTPFQCVPFVIGHCWL